MDSVTFDPKWPDDRLKSDPQCAGAVTIELHFQKSEGVYYVQWKIGLAALEGRHITKVFGSIRPPSGDGVLVSSYTEYASDVQAFGQLFCKLPLEKGVKAAVLAVVTGPNGDISCSKIVALGS